jgi:hypothetical protein
MVTPAIGGIINGVQFETSPMRAVANIETISADAIEYPRDDDEASAGWVGEQEYRPETGTPKPGVQRIPVHELYANPVTQKCSRMPRGNEVAGSDFCQLFQHRRRTLAQWHAVFTSVEVSKPFCRDRSRPPHSENFPRPSGGQDAEFKGRNLDKKRDLELLVLHLPQACRSG